MMHQAKSYTASSVSTFYRIFHDTNPCERELKSQLHRLAPPDVIARKGKLELKENTKEALQSLSDTAKERNVGQSNVYFYSYRNLSLKNSLSALLLHPPFSEIRPVWPPSPFQVLPRCPEPLVLQYFHYQ
jgi:hypothetical protein